MRDRSTHTVQLRSLPQGAAIQRRAGPEAAGRGAIDDFACAAGASPVQLAQFDAAIQLLRSSIVQCESKQADGGAAPNMQQLAAQGVQGSGGKVPHHDTIQKAFGSHDIGGVQAHVGGAAAGASKAMGAEAYATGNDVAFGKQPDLHTAAHEAAHVVQQRAGVQLAGGVGKVGDRYEQHADQVADAVVQGKSAEGLLDTMAPGGKTGGVQAKANDAAPVQMAPSGVPGAAEKNAYVVASWHLKQQMQSGQASLADLKKKNESFAKLWIKTQHAATVMEQEIGRLRGDLVKSFYMDATLTTLGRWFDAFDGIVALRDAAKSIASIDVNKVIANIKKARSGAQATLKHAQAGNISKTVSAVKGTKQQGQNLDKTYQTIKGSGEKGGNAMGELSTILGDPTKPITEEEAIKALMDFQKGLDPVALVNDKKNLAKNLTAVGLKAYQATYKYVAAKSGQEIERRRGAAEAALKTIESAHIHAIKLHRGVNHGYWSLTDAIKQVDPRYVPPHARK